MSRACLEFIRHGLPVGGSRYRGNGVDDPLSETGWRQMWQAMDEDHDWDAIVSSPLTRCREFARHFAERSGIEHVNIQEDLREIGFGSWEGQTREQLLASDGEALACFQRDPVGHPPAGAETIASMCQRVGRVTERLFRDYPEQRVLVVVHAGVMRAVLRLVMESPPQAFFRIAIPHAMRMTLLPGPPMTIRL